MEDEFLGQDCLLALLPARFRIKFFCGRFEKIVQVSVIKLKKFEIESVVNVFENNGFGFVVANKTYFF